LRHRQLDAEGAVTATPPTTRRRPAHVGPAHTRGLFRDASGVPFVAPRRPPRPSRPRHPNARRPRPCIPAVTNAHARAGIPQHPRSNTPFA
jgi:hypothetical protein